MQIGALIAMLRGVTLPVPASFSQFSNLSWQDGTVHGWLSAASACYVGRAGGRLAADRPLSGRCMVLVEAVIPNFAPAAEKFWD
jgi:hypothetical protein